MPNLLLIPTSIELSIVEAVLMQQVPDRFDGNGDEDPWKIERCGFGLVAAAANTARLIEQHQPKRIVLAGIAGSLNESFSVGRAFYVDRVTCHGIGVGNAFSPQYQSADQLGWKHCEGDSLRPAVGGTIRLSRRWGSISKSSNHHLISVTTASANADEAFARRSLFHDAVAEDMEGFAVALACESAGTPLEIVRGISNLAGDRNHHRWQIHPASLAAAGKVIELISECSIHHD